MNVVSKVKADFYVKKMEQNDLLIDDLKKLIELSNDENVINMFKNAIERKVNENNNYTKKLILEMIKM